MATRVRTGTTSTAWVTNTNWSPATSPANGDDCYIDQTNTTRDIAGSDESAVTLASFNAKMTNTFNLGDNGTPLKIGSSVWNIGQQGDSATAGTGSGRINLDGANAAGVWNIYDTGTATDTAKEPLRIKANSASNVANVFGGRVGFATDSIGDTATFGTINVTGQAAVVFLGAGLTLSNLNVSAGTVTQRNTVTNVSYDGGTYSTEGTYNIPTLSVSGPSCILNHRRAVTTVTITRAGQVATVAWTAHGLAVGDLVQISGADQYQYNGVQVIETVPGANSFTYTVNGAPAATATGTILANLMAVTTLNLYDGAIVDISADARPFAVALLSINGDCTIIVNPANPNQFSWKYRVVERGQLTIQA